MLRCHLIFWSLCLSIVLGAGWYKSVENRRDRARQAAWHQQIERLQTEARTEYKRTVAWIHNLYSQPGGRQQVENKLKDAWSVNWETDGHRDVANWRHEKYGIPLQTEFEQDKLVAHRAGNGHVLTMYPQPPQLARSSRAESIRRFVADWAGWLWLAALSITVLPRRWGLLAAQAMLAISLACGAAWLVTPHYTITIQGVLSNAPLFFAAIMYFTSLVCLAHHVAAELAHLDQPLRFRFGLRTLFILTAIVAILLAMGPFGYFTLSVSVAGSIIFLASLLPRIPDA